MCQSLVSIASKIISIAKGVLACAKGVIAIASMIVSITKACVDSMIIVKIQETFVKSIYQKQFSC